MDSLLANYASSDEEEEDQQPQQPQPCAKTNDDDHDNPSLSTISSLFSVIPKPKSSSSSLFQTPQEDSQTASKSRRTVSNTPSGFATLPKLKSQLAPKPTSNPSSSVPTTKRVVQFKPPVNPFSVKSTEIDDDDDEEEEEEKERRQRRQSESSSQTSSVKSFLSSIPVPKNSVTLGALPSSGSGRRAVVETELSASNSGVSRAEKDSIVETSGGNDGNYDNSASYQSGIDQNAGNYGHYYGYGNYESGTDQNAGSYGYYENYNSGFDQSGGVTQTGLGIGSGDGSNYGNCDGYGSYGDYGQYGNNWVEGPAAAVPENSGANQSGFKGIGKRWRNEVPTEIIEVKQDELIKNRPREDQVKLTGIAFGPSYQVLYFVS